MAQFDVFRTRSTVYPLRVDVQADPHARLDTRVVLPLVPRARYGERRPTRLTPLAEVRGEDYVAVTFALVAVPRSTLGAFVDAVASHRPTLIAALDVLLTGS